jgi:predicted Zn-dependent protease
MRAARTYTLALVCLGLGLSLVGCSVVEQGVNVLNQTGQISDKDKDTLLKTGEALRSTFADIKEEEEYYIGRAVAALILSKYSVYNNDSLTQYVNIVGNSLALYSNRPEIYAGYHFLILDTEELNALAAPGGMIFITKGLLRRCKDEDTLALVLSHEIGHVCAKHGLQAIKKSRLLDVFKILGSEAAQRFAPAQLSQLTAIFENVLADIVGQLIERGYDRKYEYEADKLAVTFGAKTAYDPDGITRFLQTMVGDTSSAAGKGWFRTHPTPEQRIDKLKAEIAGLSSVPKLENVRTLRFKQYFSSLR